MSKYLVWEYSQIKDANDEVTESMGAYKYDTELQALKVYHQKLAGACSNDNYVRETVILTNIEGHKIMSETIPSEIYRNLQ